MARLWPGELCEPEAATVSIRLYAGESKTTCRRTRAWKGRASLSEHLGRRKKEHSWIYKHNRGLGVQLRGRALCTVPRAWAPSPAPQITKEVKTRPYVSLCTGPTKARSFESNEGATSYLKGTEAKSQVALRDLESELVQGPGYQVALVTGPPALAGRDGWVGRQFTFPHTSVPLPTHWDSQLVTSILHS
jgi:hypothetical protein